MLGDSFRSRDAYTYLIRCKSGFYGCMMGAALIAVGKAEDENNRNARAVLREWPWLSDISDLETQYAFETEVTERFHLVARGEMTYEQLIDYVRSVEPECGECCRFECICAKQSEMSVESTVEA